MTEILFLRTTIAGTMALALDQGHKIFLRQNLALYTSGTFNASPHIHLVGPLSLVRRNGLQSGRSLPGRGDSAGGDYSLEEAPIHNRWPTNGLISDGNG